MLKHTLQPPVISLFSSTSSHPLLLCTHASTSSSFSEDAWISLVDDSTDQLIPCTTSTSSSSAAAARHPLSASFGTPTPSSMKGRSDPSSSPPSHSSNIFGNVLHLQSPDIKTTFVRWGARQGPSALGIEAGYLHLWLKEMGEGMGFYLDVTILDDRGGNTVIRASTFQSQPRYDPRSSPPLLHLPLRFPASSSHRLTSWSLLSLPLPDLLASLSDLGGPSPSPRYKSLQSVEIHANCRLKRIWVTSDRGGGVVGESMALRGMMTELVLFAAAETPAEGN